MLNAKYGKMIISAVIFITSLFLYYEAGKFRQLKAVEQIGPDFWPKIILILLCILSFIALLSDILKKPTEKFNTDTLSNETKKRFLITLICIFTYIIILHYVGFAISTPIFIFIFMLILGEQRKWLIFLTSILMTAAVIIIFSKFFLLAIPRGFGLFRNFSLFFY
jgi:putative tricarboxylic transport membrane protein